MEGLGLASNATITLLFLVRTRPSRVSLNPLHWLVALLTSFSGLFFEGRSTSPYHADLLGDALILLGLTGSGSAAVALGRSYDFLPALRGVSTGWLYRYVRHPMYVSSIVMRLG